MPINKYDRPAQAQFMDTYVPIPFNELLAAGQAKQQRYDQSAGAMDAAIAAAEDITAIPYSEDERRAKQYISNMRAIRDKYINKDLSDPFVNREMSNELRNAVDKEDIKHIQQSYIGYMNYNKMLAENAQRGVDTPPELIQNFVDYNSKDPNQGVFTGTPSVYKDPLRESQEFFNNLKPTELGPFREKIDGVETGRIGTKEGVTVDRIINHANENMDAFVKLPAIKQMIEVARKRGDNRDAKVIAGEYVRAHAPEWAYVNTGNYAYDPYYKERASGRNNNDYIKSPELQRVSGLEDGTILKSRQINRKKDELQKQSESGNMEATQQLKEIQKVEAKIDNKYNALNNDDVKSKAIQDILIPAVNALITKGYTKEEAIDKLKISNIGDFLITDLQSTEGRLENAKDKLGNLVDFVFRTLTTDNIGLTTTLTGKLIDNDKLIEGGKKIREVGKEVYNIRKKGRESDKNANQIILDYNKALYNLNRKFNDLDRQKEKEKAETISSLFGHQRTYTPIATSFEFKNGIIQERFYDENNNLKYRDSGIAQELTDMLHNAGNYQERFYDKKGKLSRKSINDIRTLFEQSDGFAIVGFDNEVGTNGGPVYEMQIQKKDASGDLKPVGEKFFVEGQVNSPEDVNIVYNDLMNLGKEKAAWNYVRLPYIKSVVSNIDFDADIPEAPLSKFTNDDGEDPNNKIVFIKDKDGVRHTPALIYNGNIYMMSDSPLIFNNLSKVITTYLKTISTDSLEK